MLEIGSLPDHPELDLLDAALKENLDLFYLCLGLAGSKCVAKGYTHPTTGEKILIVIAVNERAVNLQDLIRENAEKLGDKMRIVQVGDQDDPKTL
jgi:hypothetical protein